MGGLLAVTVPNTTSSTWRDGRFSWLACVGLAMVLLSYHFVQELSGGLVVGVTGATLILAFGQSGGCRKLLAQPLLIHIGKISYSLYLWHWPVLIFAEDLGYSWHRLWLFIPIYLLASASFYFVERPTRHRKGILPLLLGGYALTLAFSAWLAFSPGHYDTSRFEKPVYYGKHYCLNPAGVPESFDRLVEDCIAPEPDHDTNAYLTGGIIVGSDDAPPEIVVLGDSQGVMWSNAIRTVTESLDIKTAFYSMNGVSPFMSLPPQRDPGPMAWGLSPDTKLRYDVARIEWLQRWNPKLVILCTAWSRTNEAQTADLMQFLSENAIPVLLMEQPPLLLGTGRHNSMQYLVFRGLEPRDNLQQYLPAGNVDGDDITAGKQRMADLCNQFDSCDAIRVFDLYAKDDQTLVLQGNNVVYLDFMPLTEYGTQLAVPRIENAIREAFPNRAP